MDTDWFAVDRDGRVALFSSGENGAVADGAAQLDAYAGPAITLDDIAPEGAATSAPVYDWAGFRRGGTRHEAQYLGPDDDASLLMFVRDVTHLVDDLAAGRAVPVASTEHSAVMWRADAVDAIARVHERKHCLRCAVLAPRDFGGRRPGDAGLYHYAHVHDGGTPMPYLRLEAPSQPRVLDAVPAKAREALGAVRFDDVSFADAVAVQPFTHAPSSAYGGAPCAFVDEAGDEHPIPGREDDFRRERGEDASPEEILFYGVGDEYGFMSNFAPAPVRLKGRVWPTTEHYFQAQKFAGTRHEGEVRAAKTPMIAARMGRDRSRPLRRDWESVKVSVMRDAVMAKFVQHDDLRAQLLATGDAPLVEHTENDSYWGDGGDGSGQNMLGRILVEVRAALRARDG